MSLVWNNIIKHSDEYTFECPITGSGIDTSEYHAVYGPFLETLDGRDLSSYVDFFFERSPINRYHWMFVDEDAKADFVDFCLEMKIIPELDLIKSGDLWLKKMNQREIEREKEKQREEQKKKQKGKKKMTSGEKQEKIRQQCQISLENLENELKKLKLEEDDSEEKIKKVQGKILKIRRQLEKMNL